MRKEGKAGQAAYRVFLEMVGSGVSFTLAGESTASGMGEGLGEGLFSELNPFGFLLRKGKAGKLVAQLEVASCSCKSTK